MPDATYVPIPPPTTPASPLPPTELNVEQKSIYASVLEHFSQSEYVLDDHKLQDREKFWLSSECLQRFLRGSKWKEDIAVQRLEATLRWRRSFGIESKVTPEHVEPEAVTGKEIIFGYDVHGRPGFYMIPSRQNTEESPRQVEYAFFMFERAIDLMPRGVESIALLIDFGDRGKNPSMSTSRTVLNILQEHYPERLGVALITNVPMIINMFFKLIMPFVDPVTRQKVKFNPSVIKDGIFGADNVMARSWGGDVEFVYEHDKYWKAFIEMAQTRHNENFDRWKQLGGRVGIKEWDYKSGSGSVENGAAAELISEAA